MSATDSVNIGRLQRSISFSLFVVCAIFLFSSEFLASVLNNKLDASGANFLQRVAFTFKPSVIAVFLGSWIAVNVLTSWILKPLFAYLKDGRNYDKARKVTLKFPWIMIITIDILWIVGTLIHMALKNLQPESGIFWAWVEFMKLANGNMSALFSVLVINTILMRVRRRLNLTDIREGENDLFIRNKDYVIVISIALYIMANMGYVSYYFNHRPGGPDMALLTWSVVLTGLGLLATSLGLIVYSKRDYYYQVNLLKERLLELRQGGGDLSRRIVLTNFDEIGDLAYSFNVFLDNLNADIQALKNIVGQVQSHSEKLFESARLFAGTSEDQARSTSRISESMKGFSAAMRNVQVSVLRQTENIQSNTEAARKLADGIRSIVDRIQSVRGTTDRNLKSAEDGIRKAKESMDKSQAMHGSVDQITGKIREAGDQSGHIDTILRSVEDIAERTNFLSMNASIEAAHAGDAGRGFAIVAQEIRELAQTAGSSVQSISGLLGVIRDIITEAVDLTRSLEREARDSSALARDSEQGLQGLIGNMQAIARMVFEIGRIVEEQDQIAKNYFRSIEELMSFSGSIRTTVEDQTSGSARIEETLSQLSTRIGENVRSSENLTASARELESVGRELARISGRFKVRENGSDRPF